MALPVGTSSRKNPDHALLHSEHINAKTFGATGDGTTDDTAALQAAINAAGTNLGVAQAYIPAGNYIISSTLSLDTTQAVILRGALGNDVDPSPGTWNKSGTRIFGNFNGPLVKKTTGTQTQMTRIEDIGFQNNHATGTCIELQNIEAPTGVFNCNIRGHIGIQMSSSIFNGAIENCTFLRAGDFAGSRGIYLNANATPILNADINAFERGIYLEQGGPILGFRIEVCGTGIWVGGNGFSGGGLIGSGSMESNDVGVFVQSASSMLLHAIGINAGTGAPSGTGIYGVDVQNCENSAFIGISEALTHSAAFIRSQSAANNVTYMNCRSTTAWDLSNMTATCQIVNCKGVTDVVRSPVIATGSLPAAGTAQNGRTVIEDNGAGDRNLIIYAGGQRFRIDGGAAI